MTTESILSLILIFGVCLGGFIISLYLSSKQDKN